MEIRSYLYRWRSSHISNTNMNQLTMRIQEQQNKKEFLVNEIEKLEQIGKDLMYCSSSNSSSQLNSSCSFQQEETKITLEYVRFIKEMVFDQWLRTWSCKAKPTNGRSNENRSDLMIFTNLESLFIFNPLFCNFTMELLTNYL